MIRPLNIDQIVLLGVIFTEIKFIIFHFSKNKKVKQYINTVLDHYFYFNQFEKLQQISDFQSDIIYNSSLVLIGLQEGHRFAYYLKILF